MPRFDLECTYCGHRWQANFWSDSYLRDTRCPNGNCRDKNLKAKQINEDGNNDIFGYHYKAKEKGKKSYY